MKHTGNFFPHPCRFWVKKTAFFTTCAVCKGAFLFFFTQPVLWSMQEDFPSCVGIFGLSEHKHEERQQAIPTDPVESSFFPHTPDTEGEAKQKLSFPVSEDHPIPTNLHLNTQAPLLNPPEAMLMVRDHANALEQGPVELPQAQTLKPIEGERESLTQHLVNLDKLVRAHYLAFNPCELFKYPQRSPDLNAQRHWNHIKADLVKNTAKAEQKIAQRQSISDSLARSVLNLQDDALLAGFYAIPLNKKENFYPLHLKATDLLKSYQIWHLPSLNSIHELIIITGFFSFQALAEKKNPTQLPDQDQQEKLITILKNVNSAFHRFYPVTALSKSIHWAIYSKILLSAKHLHLITEADFFHSLFTIINRFLLSGVKPGSSLWNDYVCQFQLNPLTRISNEMLANTSKPMDLPAVALYLLSVNTNGDTELHRQFFTLTHTLFLAKLICLNTPDIASQWESLIGNMQSLATQGDFIPTFIFQNLLKWINDEVRRCQETQTDESSAALTTILEARLYLILIFFYRDLMPAQEVFEAITHLRQHLGPHAACGQWIFLQIVLTGPLTQALKLSPIEAIYLIQEFEALSDQQQLEGVYQALPFIPQFAIYGELIAQLNIMKHNFLKQEHDLFQDEQLALFRIAQELRNLGPTICQKLEPMENLSPQKQKEFLKKLATHIPHLKDFEDISAIKQQFLQRPASLTVRAHRVLKETFAFLNQQFPGLLLHPQAPPTGPKLTKRERIQSSQRARQSPFATLQAQGSHN